MGPHHYRKRLVDNIPFDYDVDVDAPVILGKYVISVKTTITLPNGKKSAANGTATVQNDDGNTTPDSVMYAVREAQSTGLKLALTNFGMGLDLYFDRDGEEEKPARRQQRTAAQRPAEEPDQADEEEEEEKPRRSTRNNSGSSGGNDWAKKREKFTVPFGKYKGTTYADLEDNYVEWYLTNIEKDEKNEKSYACFEAEKKFRVKEGNFNPTKGKPKNGGGEKKKLGSTSSSSASSNGGDNNSDGDWLD